VGGVATEERVRLSDPPAVARRWADAGFGRLHIVDLDAALGAGENDAVVDALLDAGAARCQVGGGVCTTQAVRRLLDRGASHVVVGTRALSDAAWLDSTAAAHPQRVIVALDARDGRVVTDGWTRTTSIDVLAAIERTRDLPLAGVLLTAVEREGRLAGTDLPLMERAAARAAAPLIASGGITTLDELRALRDRGIGAAVLGMALYTGALDPERVAREFGE
jgi:phosphoribosylformimino-5-aminoimidazole carboxamide ribotide isomerase